MVNTVEIGRRFEKKAFDYLKNIFDEVEWLSEINKSVFDFRIIRDGKFLYGDAKFTSYSKPVLSQRQKEASFIVTNNGDEILFIEKDNFKGNILVDTDNGERRTIKIKLKTYLAIKKLGIMGETFDDVLQRIMGLHKKELKESKQTEKDKRTASML